VSEIDKAAREIHRLKVALIDIRAVLLCPMNIELKVRSVRQLVEAALHPKPATNASALRLTLADEQDGPQIAPQEAGPQIATSMGLSENIIVIPDKA
jgi:hypothetical protein